MNQIIYPKDIPPFFALDSIESKQLSWDAMRVFCSSLDPDKTLESVHKFISQFIPVKYLAVGFLQSHSNETVAFRIKEGGGHTVHAHTLLLQAERREKIFKDPENFVRICHEDADVTSLKIFQDMQRIKPYSFIVYRIMLEENTVIANLTLQVSGHNMYSIRDASFLHAIYQPIEIFFLNFLEHYKAIEHNKILAQSNRILRKTVRNKSLTLDALPGLVHVCKQIRQSAPLETPVLIMGETGVGKELVADAVQDTSLRSQAPYVKVNCGAIPENLVDSELFGHERGAFTGAITARQGRFERANKGTLLLDEIGELPLMAQSRLLRILQTGEFDRVGGLKTIQTDIRLIAATNVDLEAKIKEGTFREDLFYRLNVFPITVPPLRERQEDILILAEYFIKKITEKNRFPMPLLRDAQKAVLLSYAWPGNVRQLRNVLEYSLILWAAMPQNPFILSMPDQVIRKNIAITAKNEQEEEKILSLDEVMDSHIMRVLKHTHGRINGKNGAADILKINPNTLRSRMNKRGILYGQKAHVYSS